MPLKVLASVYPSCRAAATVNAFIVEPTGTGAMALLNWLFSQFLPPYIATTAPVPGSTETRPSFTPSFGGRREALGRGGLRGVLRLLVERRRDAQSATVDLVLAEAELLELVAHHVEEVAGLALDSC